MAMRDWTKSIPSVIEKRATSRPDRPAPEQEPRQQVQADRHQGAEEDADDAPRERELADVDARHRAIGGERQDLLVVRVRHHGARVETDGDRLEGQPRVREDGVAVGLDGVDGPARSVRRATQDLRDAGRPVEYNLRDRAGHLLERLVRLLGHGPRRVVEIDVDEDQRVARGDVGGLAAVDDRALQTRVVDRDRRRGSVAVGSVEVITRGRAFRSPMPFW